MFWMMTVIIFGILAKIELIHYSDKPDQHDLSTYGIICIAITILSAVTILHKEYMV